MSLEQEDAIGWYQRLRRETTNLHPKSGVCFSEQSPELQRVSISSLIILNIVLTESDDLALTDREIVPAGRDLAVEGEFTVLHLFLERRKASCTQRIVQDSIV